MRLIAISFASILAGCSATAHTAADPKPGTAVAFSANTDAEFQEAAESAKEWCAETYSKPAKFIDSRADASGRVVRFSCTVD